LHSFSLLIRERSPKTKLVLFVNNFFNAKITQLYIAVKRNYKIAFGFTIFVIGDEEIGDWGLVIGQLD